MDLGETEVGAPLTKTFFVRNIGAADLNLGATTVTGDFSLAAGFGSATLSTGESTSFSVTFDASQFSVLSAAVSFTSNDSNENPFDINLSANRL